MIEMVKDDRFLFSFFTVEDDEYQPTQD